MGKTRILIVDDEEALGRTLKLNLEDTGNYEVQTETQGTRTLDAVYTFKPDIIVLDFVMPDMDGSEVANRLMQDKFAKEIPVIFLTAIATKDDNRQQGNVIGGYFVLAKPVTTDQLIDGIEKNLKRRM